MDPNDLDLSTIDGTVIFFFLLQIGSWNSRDKSDIVRSMGLVSPKKNEEEEEEIDGSMRMMALITHLYLDIIC